MLILLFFNFLFSVIYLAWLLLWVLDVNSLDFGFWEVWGLKVNINKWAFKTRGRPERILKE